MKKNLLLYILLGFLILMNGFFLFKHFGSIGERGPKNQGPSNFIATELQFDENQMQQFEQLNIAHRKEIRTILDDVKLSKDAMFSLIPDNTVNDFTIDSIITVIANKEKKRELATFNFFRSVNELCNEEQAARLALILKDALHHPGSENREGPPPGGRGPENRPPPPGH
ncbi:hypothetical protein JQC67_16530 [Aurantibacter crassamenti]|uniref:hypothetical protein n=1 Tax=Aurantibacter crassamenti TaxID=1837375 RepID=UPI00193A8026|nr:hypothetical protein [Aurantibacter crassamenti]MBM1107764.1 hypothetical protein [Aurantibacter crassamenti]